MVELVEPLLVVTLWRLGVLLVTVIPTSRDLRLDVRDGEIGFRRGGECAGFHRDDRGVDMLDQRRSSERSLVK